MVDSGFSTINLNCYFYRLDNLSTVDLSLLDASRATGLFATFCCDYKVETIKLPSFTSKLFTLRSCFAACYQLKTLNIGPSDVSGVTSFYHAFLGAMNLKFDCSDWNVNPSADHEDMNVGAPGAVLPKVWQATPPLCDEGKEEDAIEAPPEVAGALALEAEEGQGENGAAATGKADGPLPATVPGDEEDADDEEGEDESLGGTVSGTPGDTGVNVHGGGDEGCPVGNSVAEAGKDVIM